MQKPINEQYFDLWKRLDEVWEQGEGDNLSNWREDFITQIEQLQKRVKSLDNISRRKWLKLFRPVSLKLLEACQPDEPDPQKQLSKYRHLIQSFEKRRLAGKLLKLFQGMEFDVDKEQGKCNCQLKHDLKMILHDMADMNMDNMKVWEKHLPIVIYQCQECGIYWKRNQRLIDPNGTPWEYLGNETEYDLS